MTFDRVQVYLISFIFYSIYIIYINNVYIDMIFDLLFTLMIE